MGGSTTVQQPAPPAAPTASDNAAALAAAAPATYQAAATYNPQYAALDYNIAQQYGPQYAELYKKVNEQLYPETAGLQENLAGQAVQGMSGAVPDAMKQQYIDQLRSELGPNAGSGIGADYVSRGMINQGEQYKNYYQNLALSLAGRQPLGQYATPTGQNVAEGFNYGNVANNAMQGYGSYAGLYGNMYNSNANLQGQNYQSKMNMYGSIAGAGGVMGASAMKMCWVAAEVFGGWEVPSTKRARYFIINQAPTWFRELYRKFGERFSKFISNKPMIKSMIKPLFNYFADKSEGEVDG